MPALFHPPAPSRKSLLPACPERQRFCRATCHLPAPEFRFLLAWPVQDRTSARALSVSFLFRPASPRARGRDTERMALIVRPVFVGHRQAKQSVLIPLPPRGVPSSAP